MLKKTPIHHSPPHPQKQKQNEYNSHTLYIENMKITTSLALKLVWNVFDIPNYNINMVKSIFYDLKFYVYNIIS
jgi:hypothetical protein